MGRFTRKLLSSADAGGSPRCWVWPNRGLRPVLASAAALVAATLAAPASSLAAAQSPEFFGTNFSTITELNKEQGDKRPVMLAHLAQGRMVVNRFDARWRDIEPSGNRNGPGKAWNDPGYTWGTTDAMIRLMAERGLRGAPSFRFEPRFAQIDPDAEYPRLSPDSYDDYGRMIAAFAKRYGEGGTFWAANPALPKLWVQTYELWNEVNLDEYAWNRDANADSYAAMIKIVSPLIKSALPSAIILGSLSWKDRLEEAGGEGIEPDYVAKLAANGGLAGLDGMGYHPYAPDAQATIDLVVRLRHKLDAVGRSNMPIYADEAGQEAITFDPATGTTAPTDRTPAEFAYKLFPSDSARAANLAYAGEALAASDCGVASFLPYGASAPFLPLVDTKNNSLPRTEAWMGLYFRSSGQPTISAQALQRASLRWAARFNAGGPGAPASTAVCTPGSSPAASMLRIDAVFTGLESGCAKVVTTYDGNPLESAYLRFFNPATGEQVAEARTNALGQAQQCVPDELRGKAFRILANIGQTGTTGIVDCDIPGVGCGAGTELRPGAGTLSARIESGYVGPSTPPDTTPKPPKTTPAACTWALTLKAGTWMRDKKGTRGRQRLTASVTCNTAPAGARVRFAINRKAAKGSKESKLRTLWLTVGKPRLVGVPAVRPGERVVFVHRAEPTIGVPRLRDSIPVGVKPSR